MSNPAYLNINESAVAFSDQQMTSNPKRRFFDWTRNVGTIAVNNPKSEQYTIPSRTMVSLFSGARATTIGSNTAWDVKFMGSSRYRFIWTGGTDPSLETSIAMTFTNPSTISVTVNSNATITLTASTGTPFTNVLAGHTIYIYSVYDTPATSSPQTYWFNVANAGWWNVLSASPTTVVLTKPSGQDFQAIVQTVTVNSTSGANQIIAYAGSVGIEAGDKVDIEATTFLPDTRKTYTVIDNTSVFFDVISVQPIAEQTGVTGTNTGMSFYYASKRFLRFECDQDAKVYINGSSSEFQIVSPWTAADPDQMGWYEVTGPVWSLACFNRSSDPMVVNLFSAE